MKRQLLLISGISLISVFSFSQAPTSQPNGVIVHQAQGVETPTNPISTEPVSRTIENWTLAEIIEAEPYFSSKLSNAYSEEDKHYYTEQLELMRKRKLELSSGVNSQTEPKSTN